jgi:hypothetical protein
MAPTLDQRSEKVFRELRFTTLMFLRLAVKPFLAMGPKKKIALFVIDLGDGSDHSDMFRKFAPPRRKCMAEDIEMQLKTRRHEVHNEPSLRQLLGRLQDEHSAGISERERALLEISSRIASLLDNLSEEICGEHL